MFLLLAWRFYKPPKDSIDSGKVEVEVEVRIEDSKSSENSIKNGGVINKSFTATPEDIQTITEPKSYQNGHVEVTEL